jgi:hypothetical protein
VHRLAVRVDPVGGVLHPFGAGALCDRAERIPAHAAFREGRVDRQRPVAELLGGRHQRDLEGIAGQAPQAKASRSGEAVVGALALEP